MKYGFTVEDHDYDIQVKALSEYGCDAVRNWPSLSELADLIVSGDEVICWRADKLASCIDDLQQVLTTIHNKGAAVCLIQEGLTTAPGDQCVLDQLVAIVDELNKR